MDSNSVPQRIEEHADCIRICLFFIFFRFVQYSIDHKEQRRVLTEPTFEIGDLQKPDADLSAERPNLLENFWGSAMPVMSWQTDKQLQRGSVLHDRSYCNLRKVFNWSRATQKRRDRRYGFIGNIEKLCTSCIENMNTEWETPETQNKHKCGLATAVWQWEMSHCPLLLYNDCALTGEQHATNTCTWGYGAGIQAQSLRKYEHGSKIFCEWVW